MGDEQIFGRLASLRGNERFRPPGKVREGVASAGLREGEAGVVWFALQFVHRSGPNRRTRQ